MRDFHEYEAYRDAMRLCGMVYRLSQGFPEDEKWGLSRQVRRAVVSVPSNIAEGAGRTTPTDFARFLDMAIGSLNEVETQMAIAAQLDYLGDESITEVVALAASIRRQLGGLARTIRSTKVPRPSQS